MVLSITRILGLAVLLGAAGCAATPPPAPVQPPGNPPTPKTVSSKNPGGDAADPEKAALERLLREPWGHKTDRFNTMNVPLADREHWRRVRLWSHPTRAAFRFGDNHYAVVGLWYTPAKGASDPEACLAQFFADAQPPAAAYGARMGETRLQRAEQLIDGQVRPMMVRVIDGGIESMFDSNDYAGAVVAYESWPGTCLVHGFAVVSGKHKELGRKVRDRWVIDGAPRLRWHNSVLKAPPFNAK